MKKLLCLFLIVALAIPVFAAETAVDLLADAGVPFGNGRLIFYFPGESQGYFSDARNGENCQKLSDILSGYEFTPAVSTGKGKEGLDGFLALRFSGDSSADGQRYICFSEDRVYTYLRQGYTPDEFAGLDMSGKASVPVYSSNSNASKVLLGYTVYSQRKEYTCHNMSAFYQEIKQLAEEMKAYYLAELEAELVRQIRDSEATDETDNLPIPIFNMSSGYDAGYIRLPGREALPFYKAADESTIYFVLSVFIREQVNGAVTLYPASKPFTEDADSNYELYVAAPYAAWDGVMGEHDDGHYYASLTIDENHVVKRVRKLYRNETEPLVDYFELQDTTLTERLAVLYNEHSVEEDAPAEGAKPTATPTAAPTATPDAAPTDSPALSESPSPGQQPEASGTPSPTPVPTKTDEPETAGEMATYLHAKGLLLGTDNGFDLEKTMTRAEGITMLIRLLEKEEEALNDTYTAVFDDVPKGHWAYSYVMYAKTSGITHGTGENTFTPDRDMSGEEFLALLLRALGHEEIEPDHSVIVADALGLLSDSVKEEMNDNTFLRGEMVQIAYRVVLQ